MATAAVLRSHDVLDNRMHLEAFSVSPASKPRRRRHTKPAAGSVTGSPPTKMAVVSSPVVKTARVASPPPKATTATVAQGRRSPPARPAAARKQGSPTKELPKQKLVMGEIRILKRGEEPPAPAPAPSPAPVAAQAAPVVSRTPAAVQAAPVDQRIPRVPVVAQAPPVDQKVHRATRSKQQHPAAVPTKSKSVPNAAGYAGPAFSSASPEPSSLPFPAFIMRAEAEATRGLRCLLRIGELP
ncbi:transcriptional regulatory protein AlgP-like [Oryza brachyantha]|uniref:Uncharacterized protein n=1 Tax=Oryza brachyantha TaxID=4533 RepID=J3LI13_ORYBR|nr:transcriptional regulatory protein AlgP-like [Oryza brachyantha]